MTTEIKLDGQLISKDRAFQFRTEIEKAFAIELTDEVARIQIRTRKGQDKNDNTFKPLSNKYAAYKAAGGRVNVKRTPNNAGKISAAARRPISNQVNPTDLRFTGEMLQALTSTTQKNGDNYIGTIGFLSAAAGKKAIGNIDKGRDFFGVTKDFWARLQNRIQQIWSK